MARRSDHTREQIQHMAIEAAEVIVRDKGFAGLSARKVAKQIGYTVGTLYLVFKNLDELILRVNMRTLERLHNTLKQAAENTVDPRLRIAALAHAYIKFASEDFLRWSLLFEHHIPEQSLEIPTEFQQRIASLFSLVENALIDVRPSAAQAQTAHAARALWSGIHGVCILGLGNKLPTVGAGSIFDIADELIDSYITGYTHREPAHKKG